MATTAKSVILRDKDDGKQLLPMTRAELVILNNGTSVETGLAGKEDTTNKVTSLSSSSNNKQYPSALCVYNVISGLTSPFTYKVVSALPTASESTMGAIYVVTDGTDTDFYITAENSGSYSWQPLGTLDTSITTITNGEIDALFT